MDVLFLRNQRRSLEQERDDVLERVLSIERDLRTMDEENEAEAMDHAQELAAGAILSRLDEQERHQLGEIEAALRRIEDGHYGRCESCGSEIDQARLKALPAARRCAACQEREEEGSS